MFNSACLDKTLSADNKWNPACAYQNDEKCVKHKIQYKMFPILVKNKNVNIHRQHGNEN